jgi:hypothetical protein
LIVTVDTNVLVKWFSKKKSDSDDIHRLNHYLEKLSKHNGKLIIPTPCLAEFLVGVDDTAMTWFATLEKRRSVMIAPFDRRAAFECMLLDKAAIGKGDKKGGRKDAWQKIKIDRQIVSIARAQNSTEIISEDDGLRVTALAAGLQSFTIADLELPSHARQGKLLLNDSDS